MCRQWAWIRNGGPSVGQRHNCVFGYYTAHHSQLHRHANFGNCSRGQRPSRLCGDGGGSEQGPIREVGLRWQWHGGSDYDNAHYAVYLRHGREFHRNDHRHRYRRRAGLYYDDGHRTIACSSHCHGERAGATTAIEQWAADQPHQQAQCGRSVPQPGRPRGCLQHFGGRGQCSERAGEKRPPQCHECGPTARRGAGDPTLAWVFAATENLVKRSLNSVGKQQPSD